MAEFSQRISHTPLASLVAFAIAFIHGLAPAFVYDAAQYWGGALALFTGGDPVLAGGLATRGVFTAGVYLPPALLTAVLGGGAAEWAVLTWNALMIAMVCAVLVPRFVQAVRGMEGRPPAAQVWISAVLGSVLLSGFARFPLMDVVSTGLAFAGLYGILVTRRWPLLVLSGLAIAAGANMRPSLLAPIVVAVVVLLFVRAGQVAIAVAGGVLALIPQLALNVLAFGSWSIVPRETAALSAVQAAYAHVALRYDTVAFADQRPQQWYCDPLYASLVVDDGVPRNQFQVVGSALAHLPDSLWFLFRKAAASIHWSLETPYEPPPGSAVDVLTVLVVMTAALGVVILAGSAIRERAERRRLSAILALLGFWFGALAVLVFATPETRFAVPIVLVGLIGVVSVIPARISEITVTPGSALIAACGLLLAAALFLGGAEALSHSLPAGPLTDARACAASR